MNNLNGNNSGDEVEQDDHVVEQSSHSRNRSAVNIIT